MKYTKLNAAQKKERDLIRDECISIADNFIYCDTDKKAKAYIGELNETIVSCDTETIGLNPLAKNVYIRLVQIFDAKKVVVFDLKKLGRSSLRLIAEYFANKERTFIFQNAKFDLKWLRIHLGVKNLNEVFDTFLASQILSCGRVEFGHSLKDIVHDYFNINLDKQFAASNWSLDTLDLDQLIYSARDTVFLRFIREWQIEELKEHKLLDTANIEMQCVEPIANLELNGIYLNGRRWMEIAERNKLRAIRMESKIAKELTRKTMLFDDIPSFKVTSTMQLKDAMRDANVEIPVVFDKKTGKNKETLSVDELEKIVNKHKVHEMMIKHSALNKNHTSFGANYLKFIDEYDGRIHPEFKQIGAETGRMSCKKPNLQQIKREYIYRACFTVENDEDCLVISDYSQIELRLAAEMSGDVKMIKAFEDGLDLHTYTASEVFKVDYAVAAKDKTLRQRAKDLNFGIVYGIGASRFAASAEIEIFEAEIIIHNYFSLYRGLKRWLDWAKSQATRQRKSRTISGRLFVHRFDPANKHDFALAERNGMNMPIQGSSADITKIAAKKVYDDLQDKARLVNIVHDELDTQTKKEYSEYVAERQTNLMIQAAQVYMKKVPVKVDTTITDKWCK